MPPTNVTRIGPYEVSARIGEGGMGEVFRARDPRLNREVALKLLHVDALGSPDRIARFQQEVRVVAALNHPNILTIHEAGEADGRPYLVSELIDGETLRSVLSRGHVPSKRLLALATQIADGLAAAHASGITHRDLKPENIMVTRDGRVKILDFGLAKLTGPGSEDETATHPGVMLGTVAYMSPEQARAEPVDFRSDQFSLGLILHEMATGRQTFRRNSTPETLTAILREEAAPLDATIPTPLRWTIERLLAKNRDDRFASTLDLHHDLRHLRDHFSEASSITSISAPEGAPARRRFRWLVLALCAIAGIAAGIALRPRSTPDLAYRFTPISRDEPAESDPQWSPDGKSIVYTSVIHGVSQVFTRTIGATAAAQITRVEKSCRAPVWSPDGSRIYFLSTPDVWAVAASGGTPQLVLKNAGLSFSVR